MNNLLVKSPSNDTNLSKPRQATPFLKLVVFTIGGLNLALRIESVYKVVNHTPVFGSGLNHVGITHLGDSLRDSSTSQEVTVVDLHWRFFKSNQAKDLNAG
ncbi:MAG TPA: chemotaxis protein CheW, partial [Coleofasciculaceae cyanobacterium]